MIGWSAPSGDDHELQDIATAAGSQPKPEKVAEGISTALFHHARKGRAGGAAIFFSRTSEPDRGDHDGGHQGGRPDDCLAGPGRQAAPSPPDGPRRTKEDEPMSASMGQEMKAEPNLTPLLDVVFQLITFFMLVINFSNENYDQRVRLPVAGSARPVRGRREGGGRGPARLEHRQGGPPVNERASADPAEKRLEEIKHQAALVKLNLTLGGNQAERDQGPADDHCPSRGSGHAVLLAVQPDHHVPGQRLPQVRAEGDELQLTPTQSSFAVRTRHAIRFRGYSLESQPTAAARSRKRAWTCRSRRCSTWRSSS